MPNYCRAKILGPTWFFTVNLLDWHNNALLMARRLSNAQQFYSITKILGIVDQPACKYKLSLLTKIFTFV